MKNNKKVLANGDMVTKGACRLITNITDYRYCCENYKGESETVFEDKVNTIKKSLSILLGDLELYMDSLGITEEAKTLAEKRLEKLANR